MGSREGAALPPEVPPSAVVAQKVQVLTALAIAHSTLARYNEIARALAWPEASFEDAVVWFLEASGGRSNWHDQAKGRAD